MVLWNYRACFGTLPFIVGSRPLSSLLLPLSVKASRLLIGVPLTTLSVKLLRLLIVTRHQKLSKSHFVGLVSNPETLT
jgi:hypothetical protein